MNRSRWLVLGVVALAVLAGGWWMNSRGKSDAPRYRTAGVERGSLESRVSATGTVRPVVQVQVGSQVSGTVQKLNADYNSRVHRGEVLLQIEPSSFRARMLQAQAAVARAEAALKDARRQLARARELIAQNYISQADVDAAEVAVEQREADLKQARAQLEAADVDLANTTIRAPIDGVVIARSVDVGQTVAASLQSPQLFLLANDLTRMQVETRIDEADIGQIRAGLPVSFTVDAFPDVEFRGEVAQVRLEPIVEQGVVTYTTVIQTRNPDLKLRPGMTANVSVLVERSEDVLKVPNAALRFHPPMTGAKGAKGGDPAMAQRSGGMNGGRGAAGPSGALGAGRDSVGARARGQAGAQAGPMSRGAAWARSGATAQGGPGERIHRGGTGAAGVSAATAAPGFKPGAVWVMRAGQPTRVAVMTGLSDGTSVEVRSDELKEGDALIVGLELPAAANGNLQPPPGMGGPRFGPPGGGRGGGGGRR